MSPWFRFINSTKEIIVEKLILLLALVGSVGWIVDKAASLHKKPDEGLKQRDDQIARLLEEIKLQKERAAEEISKLSEQLRQRDAKIVDLMGRLKAFEVRLSVKEEDAAEREPVQQEIDLQHADPMDEIVSEAGQRAKACLLQSKRLALAAVESKGREKERLLSEAKALAQKADEYRAIANGNVREGLAKAEASAVIEKAKNRKSGKAAESAFEMVA